MCQFQTVPNCNKKLFTHVKSRFCCILLCSKLTVRKHCLSIINESKYQSILKNSITWEIVGDKQRQRETDRDNQNAREIEKERDLGKRKRERDSVKDREI